MQNSKDIVRQGYDKVSYAYRDDDAPAGDYAVWVDALGVYLDAGAKVLDLGCGCGIPATKLLAARYAVTGVDISPVQIVRAKELVPNAEFFCADFASLDFSSALFDAIVSFYAVIHIPLDEQPDLFRNIARWLKPGGVFLATVGHQAWTGTEENWLGVADGTMFWSHTDAATYKQWLADVGLGLLEERFIPEGNSGHTLLMARKS